MSHPFFPFVPVPPEPSDSAIRTSTVHEIRQHLQIMLALHYENKATEAEIKKRVQRISALLISG